MVKTAWASRLPDTQRLQFVTASCANCKQQSKAFVYCFEAFVALFVTFQWQRFIRQRLLVRSCLVCVVNLLRRKSAVVNELFQLSWIGTGCSVVCQTNFARYGYLANPMTLTETPQPPRTSFKQWWLAIQLYVKLLSLRTQNWSGQWYTCLLYTSDAADE